MHDTIPVSFPWRFQPPHTSRHMTPRARLRRFRNRFLTSAFVADVKAGWRRSLTILGAAAVAYGAILVLRGAYVVAYAFGAVR